METRPAVAPQDISIDLPDARLAGALTVPEGARGIVLFAHGSGSSRHSPRNRYVAEVLHQRGVPFVFATGYGEVGGAPGGFQAPVIRKPYDVTQVAAAVAELLNAARQAP